MQLSQKQKFISQFAAAILKSTLNFGYFQKGMAFIADVYIRNCGLRNTWLNRCLKSSISQDPSRSNMVRATKHC